MKNEREYRGIYIQDNNESINYYEHGAHFSYKALYKRLEQIIKNNMNDKNKTKNNLKLNNNNKRLVSNLQKANSQKVIRYKNNKITKIYISRNTSATRNPLYQHINNNAGKLNKSKSMNKCLNFSKSYNEEQFNSFILQNKPAKNINNIAVKKDFGKNQTNLKKKIKNNHTVLKYAIMPNKNLHKITNSDYININNINSNYYGISPQQNFNLESELNSNGAEVSYNSTSNYQNNNYLIKKRVDLIGNRLCNRSKSKSNSENKNLKRYKKIKISSIINKRFIQKLINDSPKNNSAFLSNNHKEIYLQKSLELFYGEPLICVKIRFYRSVYLKTSLHLFLKHQIFFQIFHSLRASYKYQYHHPTE